MTWSVIFPGSPAEMGILLRVVKHFQGAVHWGAPQWLTIPHHSNQNEQYPPCAVDVAGFAMFFNN